MGMTECVDGNAGGKVEVAIAVSGDQPGALAPLESEIDTRISRQKVRVHSPFLSAIKRRNEMCRLARAALSASYCRCLPCQPTLPTPLIDSKLPQGPILKENLLVDGLRRLQRLARESPHIVAFFLADTTSRVAAAF
jgi:hypothetical protein